MNNNTYQNTVNNQTIFVRVQNNQTNCVNDNLTFNIIINPLPEFDIETPTIVCLNNPQNRLEALNPNAVYDYNWTRKGNNTSLSTTSFLDVLQGGTYIVTATTKDGTNCHRVKEITVNESINPILEKDDVIVIDDTNNNELNTYTVKVITKNNNLGVGIYQFSLIDENGNQTPFQEEPLFRDISGGIYTLIANDKNGCIPDAKLSISVIEYQKFLTPNNDGFNDTWKIKGISYEFYSSVMVYIFDRYGKFIASTNLKNSEWDGTSNGKELPSDDYWFKINLIDKSGKNYFHNGHFSLLRK
ncbi:MAG TPA: hypothetical protein DDE71_04280 [Tenacibaculum sp.]|nr:hypothetical protein [Tenacibaculum sp.]